MSRFKANHRDRKVAGLIALANEFDPWQNLLTECQQGAVDAAEEAARQAETLADQREGLERRILELQGNMAELRRRELEALADTLDPLQMIIWSHEDMKEVMGAIDASDFASQSTSIGRRDSPRTPLPRLPHSF